MKKHFYDIKNEIAYFKKVVKNMDFDDLEREKKHTDNDVHYDEFLDENSHAIFEIITESKYKGLLHWIDLIQNETLHTAIEKLSDEEKYFISLLFYEEKTQQELARIYKIAQTSIRDKFNKILLKIKLNIFKK